MLVYLLSSCNLMANKNKIISLEGENIGIIWNNKQGNWIIKSVQIKDGSRWMKIPDVSGEYCVVYNEYKTDRTPVTLFQNGEKINFPEPVYKYNVPYWNNATDSVHMNLSGKEINFYPTAVHKVENTLVFSGENEYFSFISNWEIDTLNTNDIKVSIQINTKKHGFYSIVTPTLATVKENNLQWGIIPGIFQGNKINRDFIDAFVYGHGIPDRPVVVEEKTTSTLSPILTSSKGFSFAVIAEPGTSRDPWKVDSKTHETWRLGLSLMNRNGNLSPTLYHPILGRDESESLEINKEISFAFRYSLMNSDWYTLYKHVIENVYSLNDYLTLKKSQQSLSDRLIAMYQYLSDPVLSRWRNEELNGMTIGAQSYLGGVLDSDNDAMKNSDYGSMWMLAKITNDSLLVNERLRYARNFKIAQQNTEEEFFRGAAAGQYYLYKAKKFTEEWGDYVEPVAVTYYVISDVANILLFEPEDGALKNVLRLGADRLLDWMSPDGSWEVAYDHKTKKAIFKDLKDLRPTFYGLVVAYRILGDEKYLRAAEKGANWYIKNAVDEASFLGVCGDNRFVPDFATVHSGQALLDLYYLTEEEKYLEASKRIARIYTTSIYTHPIPTNEIKYVKGEQREDWQISQVGLCFEHGGVLGSANKHGPILLASHAGFFVRMFGITGDSLFINMARAGVWGREAFNESTSSVASYYWDGMNLGPGALPHHAWWQIGWITDYLLSEANMRSNGGISFNTGIITPKVGSHVSYGFDKGRIFKHKVDLIQHEKLISIDNPAIDYIAANDKENRVLFIILMNNSVFLQDGKLTIGDTTSINKELKISGISMLNDNGNLIKKCQNIETVDFNIKETGLIVLKVNY